MTTPSTFDTETMDLAERLKALRRKMGLTQEEMAARLRVSKNYVWQMENGTKPPGPKIARDIELMENAQAQGVVAKPSGDIMRDVHLEPAQYLPVLLFAEMGELTSYDEIPKDWQEWEPVGKVPDPKAFIVILKGDSMKGRYDEGDRAILMPSSQPRQNGPVVARLRDGSTICKLYSRVGDEITFTSTNKKFKPLVVHASQVAWIYPIYRVIKSVWN